MNLSNDQKKAIRDLLAWFTSRQRTPYITLGGYAGTGKTTVVAKFRRELNKINKKIRVAFCSYTGKAARVLRETIAENDAASDNDSVSTIHSLIYSPIVNDSEVIIGWERQEEIKYDLIIVDEGSMVDQSIWTDLSSFGVPIIAVGDHGQLPPIRGDFNLMSKPMLKLNEIHRQARGNPIIKLSILARETGEIPVKRYSDNVYKIDKRADDARDEINDILNKYDENTMILCGYNFTRIKLNNHIRNYLGFESPTPEPGDRVICLRNNRLKDIYNGMLGTISQIEKVDDKWFYSEIELDGEDELFSGQILIDQFGAKSAINFTQDRAKSIDGDLFDFGYALTVHKAQGSQAERVILFEERFSKMTDDMWRKWLYTGITRAVRELIII
ncbi:AAA family ATPase [Candidatus Dojkabacteria bacterium]|nr:AAA family ATPase [Candidatus Dojkabacteria bacterium]